MKQLFVLLALGIIGYWLYTFYTQNPDDLPAVLRHSNTVSKPIPTVGPPTPVPTQPPLDSVPVKKGATLTHCKVMRFSADAVTFLCDQGIFQITYDRLPPGFAAYYVPRVPTPSPTTDPSAPTPVPTPTPTPRPTLPNPNHPVRSAEEDAAALWAYNGTKQRLEDRMKDLQAQMDHYYHQSSYDAGAMSEQQFNDAKAEYDSDALKLSELESRGP